MAFARRAHEEAVLELSRAVRPSHGVISARHKV
jgi:hypothetical protein